MLSRRRSAKRLVGVALAAAFVAPAASTASLPPAGAVLGTIRVPVRDTVLFTARGRVLFLIVLPEQHARAITVERVAAGRTRVRRIPFALAYYLTDLTAGAHGVYAGTSVVKRFTTAADKLVRLDPATLTVRARASFPGRVAALAVGDRMWASLGDGRVVRLDPRTLHVLASRRLLSARSVALEGFGLTKPALGLGSLWVLAGDRELVRLDPTTLAVRSRTRVPRTAPLSGVLGDATRVELVGRGVASVAADGTVGRVNTDANLDAADLGRHGLVGLNDARLALELLSARGSVIARTSLRDLGGELAVSGDDAWFLGDAGSGNGVVHVRLRP